MMPCKRNGIIYFCLKRRLMLCGHVMFTMLKPIIFSGILVQNAYFEGSVPSGSDWLEHKRWSGKLGKRLRGQFTKQLRYFSVLHYSTRTCIYIH